MISTGSKKMEQARNKGNEGMMGAKTKYNENFPLLAEDYARQGMINREIARSLGISRAVFYEYQKKYPDFLDSIKRGKAPIDFEVENALLKRALGYEYEEVMVGYKPGKGEEKAMPTVIRKTKKQVIPDVTAQIFWLKNRRPRLWKDKHVVGMDGTMNIKVVTAVPRSIK
jgi:hypothetical protein